MFFKFVLELNIRAMHPFLLLAIFFAVTVHAAAHKKPNIVFVLTDDQDVQLFGPHPMPKTKKYIGDKGMSFSNMFVTSPLCCPSRSSILTGKYVHNHLASNNSVSGNCSSNSWQQTAEKKAFPIYLKAGGYSTFFAGKYLNQYGFPSTGGVKHVPPGWDDWHGLVGNSRYYNYSLSVNGKKVEHGDSYEKDYLTDVIRKKALTFLDKHSSWKPFFLMLSTPACHAPFTPAPQYTANFSNTQAPRTKSFNKHGNGKHWLIEQAVSPMPNDTVHLIDGIFRDRWRTLLSVDDMIEGIVEKIERMGELDNTYFFLTSDNGYHLGQFSLPYDKRQLYDFDIRVPLMVRGPGIAANSSSKESIMSIDLAPTFLDIAGVTASQTMDGVTFKPILMSQPHGFRATVLVEHRGENQADVAGCPKYKNQGLANCDKHCVCEDSWNNTYACVRYETQKSSYKYCALQDNSNFVEVYNLKTDPHELINIAKTASPDLLSKLSKALADMSLCDGKTCHKKFIEADPRVEIN